MSCEVLEGDKARQLLALIKTITADLIDQHRRERKHLTDLLGMVRQLVELNN